MGIPEVPHGLEGEYTNRDHVTRRADGRVFHDVVHSRIEDDEGPRGHYRQCPHGFHHPNGKHSCDGCWCEGERDRREYGWAHDTSPGGAN